MSIDASFVRYGKRNEHLAFCAVSRRAQRPLPAVVVLQEAWGVDEHIRHVATRFADAGYFAFAPDLYAKDGVRPAPLAADRIAEALRFINAAPRTVFADPAVRDAELQKLGDGERQRIEETFGAIMANLGQSLDRFLPALGDGVRFLREDNEATRGQPVAAVGYCMGGGCAALLACSEPELAGAVIYYGAAPPADRIPGIQCPVLGFYGSLDARLMTGLPAFREAMQAAGKRFEPHVYEGVEHAFFNDDRPSYHAAASRDSFARTLGFFRDVLGGAPELQKR